MEYLSEVEQINSMSKYWRQCTESNDIKIGRVIWRRYHLLISKPILMNQGNFKELHTRFFSYFFFDGQNMLKNFKNVMMQIPLQSTGFVTVLLPTRFIWRTIKKVAGSMCFIRYCGKKSSGTDWFKWFRSTLKKFFNIAILLFHLRWTN